MYKKKYFEYQKKVAHCVTFFDGYAILTKIIYVKDSKSMVRSIIDFIRLNHEKGMTIKAYGYAAFYRFCILVLPKVKLEKMLGERGEESIAQESEKNIRIAKLVRFHVNRVSSHTPWESKCLVRAMTARKLLEEQHISSTLYLGVGKEGEKLVAHAWIRSGQLYVTGGDGNGYAMVAKFRTKG